MKKLIIHTCSHILVRPNGIVRYINTVMARQRALGHEVWFVTDVQPTQHIDADMVIFDGVSSHYEPNMHKTNGHVWLQYDGEVTNQVHRALLQCPRAGLVVAHDLHSYEAMSREYRDGIFIQHESDILTSGSRFSYMDDDYIASQFKVVANTDWRIGMTVSSTNVSPKFPVYTPSPMQLVPNSARARTKGLLYVGDASVRKGAKEFMEVARTLGVRPTVITHEVDAEIFSGADVHTFSLSQKQEMYELMMQHKVAYISSKNECPGLVVPECLQFMPVVVDGQYEWVKYVVEMGATVATGDGIASFIQECLHTNTTYSRHKVEAWANTSAKLWANLSQ